MKYPHWQYYKSLSEDLDRLSRFVELTEDNYSVYSTELTRILLAVGSEVDVVAKLLCKRIRPSEDPQNIVAYGKILLVEWPGIKSVEISIPSHLLSFTPWADWSTDVRPSWWTAYNNVKHERNQYFQDANLGNVLLALAGLCVFSCYLYYNEYISGGIVMQRPKMFLDHKYNHSGTILFSPEIRLPDFPEHDDDD